MNQHSNKTIRKSMLFEKFIHLLLIFRSFLKELTAFYFLAIVIVFFILKYRREGFTVGTLGQIVATIIIFIADLLQFNAIVQWGSFVAALNYLFLEPSLYHLPKYREKVGLRENFIRLPSKNNENKNLYYTEWYPLENPKNCEKFQIKWAHTKELKRMAQFKKLDRPYLFQIFKLFSSSVDRVKIQLGKGKEEDTKRVILFSHGRSATPFMYTTFYQPLARKIKIYAPQHSEVTHIPACHDTMKAMKRFREIEVSERAAQIEFLATKIPQDKEIILMGHSYGCATILTAYHSLPLSIRKRIIKIILLDPWLFPLTEQHFNAEITCPTLMLANEFFYENKDVYERNVKFLGRHSSTINYVCWKGADHKHQCDIPFVVGDSLKACKNANLSVEKLRLNLEAIEIFLDGKKSAEIEEQLKRRFIIEHIDISEQPKKFVDSLSF